MITSLQERAEVAINDGILLGAVFLSHGELAGWPNWNVRRHVLKLELPGIINSEEQVVRNNLARLGSDFERQLLREISGPEYDYFLPDTLESIAQKRGIDHQSDPQFGILEIREW